MHKNMKRLTKMMRYRRAHNSNGERVFVKKFILPYKPSVFRDPVTDEVLAFVVDVADENKVVPPMLWSCHVDTVHTMEDSNKDFMQEVLYDEECAMFYKGDGKPLGADDAAGVWLLLEMIDAGVPGSYIFHRGEERGGIGSGGMADHHAAWLSQFSYAVAFDRRDNCSIITEQAGGVCASDKFALAFGDLLNGYDPEMINLQPDPTGIFTDTANYRKLIPECTNISVGYDAEHTGGETLDALFLGALRDALVGVFIDSTTITSLPVERDPTKKDPVRDWSGYGKFDVSMGMDYDDEYERDYDRKYSKRGNRIKEPHSVEDVVNMRFSEVVDWVERGDPAKVADFILMMAEDMMYNTNVIN